MCSVLHHPYQVGVLMSQQSLRQWSFQGCGHGEYAFEDRSWRYQARESRRYQGKILFPIISLNISFTWIIGHVRYCSGSQRKTPTILNMRLILPCNDLTVTFRFFQKPPECPNEHSVATITTQCKNYSIQKPCFHEILSSTRLSSCSYLHEHAFPFTVSEHLSKAFLRWCGWCVGQILW